MRSVALGVVGVLAAAVAPASANAQYQGYYSYQDRETAKVEREYRKKLSEERRECAKKQREADSRGEFRKAQRECQKKLAEVEREFRKKLYEESRKAHEARYDRDDDDD